MYLFLCKGAEGRDIAMDKGIRANRQKQMNSSRKPSIDATHTFWPILIFQTRLRLLQGMDHVPRPLWSSLGPSTDCTSSSTYSHSLDDHRQPRL